MSLGALVLRNLTVLALLDATLAKKEVRSSLLVPIHEVNGEAVPMIAVFTDSMKAQKEDVQGRDMLGANATITLALEIACITKARTQDGEGEETFIPETDEGMEMTIDIIQRQAIAALQGSPGPWAELWRQCVMSIVGMSWERGAGIDKATRFAARRLEIDCKIIDDPTPGEAVTGFWHDTLTALAADDRTTALAATIRSAAEGAPLPEWRRWQAELGLTAEGIHSTGIAPFAGSQDSVTGAMKSATQIETEDDDTGDILRTASNAATIRNGEGGAQTPVIEADE